MEIGSEISLKIRSAIKAKLVEIGAYVDDELPDYIMVMVANKRSRVQMNNDLGLFLGSNTSSFTHWLHSLLVKLQTIRDDGDTSGDRPRKAEKSNALKETRKDTLHQGMDGGVGGNELLPALKKKKRLGDGVMKRKATSTAVDRNSEGLTDSQPDSGYVEKSSTKDPFMAHHILKHSVAAKSKNVELERRIPSNEMSGSALEEDFKATDNVNSRSVVDLKSLTKSEATPASIIHSHSRRNSSQEEKMQSSALLRKRKAPDDSNDTDKVCDPGHSAVDVAISAKGTKHRAHFGPLLQADSLADGDSSEGRTYTVEQEPQELEQPQKFIKFSNTVHLEDIKLALADVLEKTQTINDDITHFSKMLESSLRKLRPQDLSLAKLRIQQVLFEFESLAAQETMREVGIREQTSGSSQNLSCGGTNSLETASAENKNSLHINVPVDKSAGSFISHHLSWPHLNSADVDQQTSNVNSSQEMIASDSRENHGGVKCDWPSSESSHLESTESAKDSLKSPVLSEVTGHSKTMGSVREKDTAVVKSYRDQPPHSPSSFSKTDAGSPSSVHSCPVSNTSCLIVRRLSASRESTISPTDLHSKSGVLHKHMSRLMTGKNKLSPNILVDSIHAKKRLESAESSSVLRQSWHKDKSPRAADPSKQDPEDSPRHYGPEALKVLAKNLKITVINKRAANSQQASSSEESEDDDDDADSSDDDEEEDDEEDDTETGEAAEIKENEPAQNKAVLDSSGS